MAVNGKIKKIVVGKRIKVVVYCDKEQKEYFFLKSSNTISDLKTLIENDFYPKEAQCLEI